MVNCFVCKKKLGLLGFKCKCGDNQFCAQHRVPELHNCSFDFKQEQRERLAKQNPVITSDKIIKI
jgi:predicted nucleic acid binding AN1-type Zn finger protein